MKLSAWAKKNGLTYKAAWRLFKTNQLPVPTTQLKTGAILVHELPAGRRRSSRRNSNA
jgi:predicted site-specific integrase-resolvase